MARDLRDQFLLDADVVFLNHGSLGAGFLYVRRALQANVHPLVIGWG